MSLLDLTKQLKYEMIFQKAVFTSLSNKNWQPADAKAVVIVNNPSDLKLGQAFYIKGVKSETGTVLTKILYQLTEVDLN